MQRLKGLHKESYLTQGDRELEFSMLFLVVTEEDMADENQDQNQNQTRRRTIEDSIMYTSP